MSNPPQRQVITNLRGVSDSITTPSTITPDIPIAIIPSLASPRSWPPGRSSYSSRSP